MSRNVCICLILLFAIGFRPQVAFAAGLYTGAAPVNSQSDADRAGALRTALGQVLIKLSGDSAVLNRPDVAKAIGRADRYMQQYSYQPNMSADPAQPRLLLVVQFDRSSIDALLHDLNAGGAGNTPPPAAGTDSANAPVAVGGSYRLWIGGLRSAEDYARLIGALSGNEQVRALRVERAQANTVQIRVDTRGALQTLLDSLDTTRVAHRPKDAPPAVAGIDALLEFEP